MNIDNNTNLNEKRWKRDKIIIIAVPIVIVLIVLCLFLIYSNNNSMATWNIDKSSDNSECIQSLVTVYEDDNYQYQVKDGCVANYKIVYSNGEVYSLKDALLNKKVTIDELEKEGINVTKTSKQVTWTLDKSSDQDTCAQSLVTIYEDNNYFYQVADSCKADYKVVYSSGESYTLKEALTNKKVTISDLEKNGVKIIKNAKQLTWDLDKSSDNGECIQSLVTIYEDNNYLYQVADACKANYKVVYSNGDRYSLKQALTNKKVTISDLENKGVKITKTPKQVTWTLDKSSDQDMCAQSLVTIYEDNNYLYQVADSCKADYKVVFSNGETYTLKQALTNKKVTISELENKGVKITKTPKQSSWTLDKSSDGDDCASMLVTIYEDNNYLYQVADACKADYKVVFSNGETYTLKQALTNKKVTISELENKGVKITKTPKQSSWTLDKSSDGDDCASMLVTIYEDSTYLYQVADACKADYKVVYSNGESYTLSQALAQGKVTISELESKGVTIFKSKK